MGENDIVLISNRLDRILDNQLEDRERLVKVECATTEMQTGIRAVRLAQESCPGRIAEMSRQGRRAMWMTAGKLMAWVIGIVTALAGAYQAVAAIFGG